MKRKINSLRTYLFQNFASLFVLFLIVLTFCISADFSKTVHKMNYDKYESVFQQSNQQLSLIFNDVSTLAAVLDNNPELISAVNLSLHDESQYARLKNETTVQNILVSSSYYASYVKNICLYKEGKIFSMHDSYSGFSSSQVEDASWFEDIKEGRQNHIILSTSKNMYIFVCSFQNKLHETSPGIMMIFFDSKLLKDCLDNIANDKGTIICAFDSDQTLLYSRNDSDYDFLQNHIEELIQSQSGEKLRLDKTTYLFTKETNTFSGWTLVSLVPNSITLQNLIPLYLQILPLVLLILGLSIYTTFLLSRNITRPLNPLLKSMKHSSQSDFSFQPYQTRIEEINTLIYGYDEMLHQISELIQKIQIIEKEKRKTELEILQTQISPHFIYNTLNSIRWLALMQDSPKIADVISSFSTLLQITSSHPTEFITVDEELKEVSCYLDIIKFRYNANVQIVWEVEETVRSYKTLKLIIQPLVENCFCHAFSSAPTGTLTLRCYKKEEALVLEVEDDGIGFVCESSELPISHSDGHHNIGLRNIHNRIKLWFGEAYGLTITSSPGHGTKVTLTEPLLTEEKEEPMI